MREVGRFASLSGARVNFDKSSGVWLGSWGTTPDSFCGFSWSVHPSVYLGIPLQNVQSMTSYWSSRIRDISRAAVLWQAHDLSVFSRAQVCNVFLMTKLLYVLQIMCCTRLQVQKLHRVFATFIWKSPYEPMRRENLFRPVSSGGLGLAHLFVRQLTSRLFFLRDCSHPLLRAYHQCLLHSHLPLVVVSSSSAVLRLSAFMREVIAAFNFLHARFSRDYLFDISRKRLTTDLIDVLFPVPIYRMGLHNEPGQDVLCRVKVMLISPSAKSFFFRLHTATLPVKTWLHERGLFVPWSTNCVWCGVPETVDHCFMDCQDAVFFWEVFQRAFKKTIFVNHHSIRFLPVPPSVNVPLDMFMLVGMHSMWKSRAKFCQGEVRRCSWDIFRQDVQKIQSLYEFRELDCQDWACVFNDISRSTCLACK